MARTNNGIFNEIRRDYDDINDSFTLINSKYNDFNLDFFEGLAQESDDLYNDIVDLINKINGMLRSNKLEMKDTTKKYEQILSELNNKKIELSQKYNDAVEQIISSNGYLTDMEKNTIFDMNILDRNIL